MLRADIPSAKFAILITVGHVGAGEMVSEAEHNNNFVQKVNDTLIIVDRRYQLCDKPAPGFEMRARNLNLENYVFTIDF